MTLKIANVATLVTGIFFFLSFKIKWSILLSHFKLYLLKDFVFCLCFGRGPWYFLSIDLSRLHVYQSIKLVITKKKKNHCTFKDRQKDLFTRYWAIQPALCKIIIMLPSDIGNNAIMRIWRKPKRHWNEKGGKMSQLMRSWYLSHRRPAKAQASMRIRAVSPEPSLFAHMKYGSRRRVRPKIRHLAPLDGCACAFEDEKCYNLK